MRAVVRMLAEHAAILPEAALSTFDACMHAFTGSVWPDAAWRFSNLTQDGCPVEFVFSTLDNALRYTVEAGGPEMDHQQRLSAACALLQRLSGQSPCVPADLMAQWRLLQAQGTLRWGCWIGVRHDGEGERFKLYIETPPRASNRVMIGYEPGSGRTEHYFRKKPLAIGDLAALSPAAPKTLEDAFGMPIDTALRFFSPGYSVAANQPAFFLRAGWMGGAAAVRRKLLARESGSALQCYRRMLGSQADDALPDHGVVTVTPNGALRVGISGTALGSLA